MIKTSFVSPEVPKARANKTGIDFIISILIFVENTGKNYYRCMFFSFYRRGTMSDQLWQQLSQPVRQQRPGSFFGRRRYWRAIQRKSNASLRPLTFTDQPHIVARPLLDHIWIYSGIVGFPGKRE